MRRHFTGCRALLPILGRYGCLVSLFVAMAFAPRIRAEHGVCGLADVCHLVADGVRAGCLRARAIAAGLAGAGAGGLAGGVIGALVGSGIPEARAKLYESGIEEGNVVISVTPRNNEDAEYLQENWRKNRGEEVHY